MDEREGRLREREPASSLTSPSEAEREEGDEGECFRRGAAAGRDGLGGDYAAAV